MLTRVHNYINRSFGRRLLFFLVPYIVVLLVAVTLLSFNTFFNAFRQEKENSTRTLIAQVSENLDFYFRDIKTAMAYMSLNKDIVQALIDYNALSVRDRYFLNSRISDSIGNMNVFKSYISDILTVGANGYLINLPNSSPLNPKAGLLTRPWLADYRPSDHSNFHFTPPHLADYYVADASVRWVVSSILPITYDGKTLGYLQGDIDYEVLRRLLDSIYHQNDINISIITADGVVVFDRNRDQVNSRADPKILTQLVGTEGSFAADWQGESALIVYQRSEVTDWFLVASIPYAALLKPSYAVSTNILFVILPLSLVVALLVFFLIARQLRQPWNRLIRRMETATVANYRPAGIDYGVGEIAELGNRFETMLAQNSDLIERIYVADIKQKNAELQALREQITPHFVYNSLQLIKGEAIFAQNREISQIVSSIANLLRYSMDNRAGPVTVADEIGYIRAYLDIYRRRFLGKFDFEIALPDAMLGCTMQKMLLQPLVENCIKHGLAQTKSGGCIRIEGSRQDGACVFAVQDNGRGICPEDLHRLVQELSAVDAAARDGIGLFNVHQRVVLERGPGYGIIDLQSVEGEYTRVVLRV